MNAPSSTKRQASSAWLPCLRHECHVLARGYVCTYLDVFDSHCHFQHHCKMCALI